MKFFIDTANLDEIREAASLGLIDGVTTNPSLMSKEGIGDEKGAKKRILEICKLVDGPMQIEARIDQNLAADDDKHAKLLRIPTGRLPDPVQFTAPHSGTW